MNTDPDKDTEEKSPSNNLLESLSSKRATLWNDFTSKIKSDKSTPDSLSENGAASTHSSNAAASTSFMDSVKQKLQSVRLYENGLKTSDDDRVSTEPECAPLINTEDTNSVGSDVAVCGESDTSELPATGTATPVTQRKKLNKRQDSFTAEEIYLDTVASQVKNGLVEPDSGTTLVSPSKAVQEFAFAESNGTKKSKSSSKSASTSNRLTVTNGNLINFDSVQNLSQAASSKAETIVHREDDGVFDYESSG